MRFYTVYYTFTGTITFTTNNAGFLIRVTLTNIYHTNKSIINANTSWCGSVLCAIEGVWLMSAIVFTLNPNEGQINTKIGVGEWLCCKSRLKAHITQRGLQNPITLVNKLTFARIMPLCPLAYFLGRAQALQGLNRPLNIALKHNVHWVALSKHRKPIW